MNRNSKHRLDSAWRPPQNLVLFPSVRRRGLIIRTARAAADAKDPERTIAAVILRTRASHERKRIPSQLMEADLSDLEKAIRLHVTLFVAGQGRSG